MATLFKHSPTGGLYTISYGPLGRYLGHVRVAHPYNGLASGGDHALDFKQHAWKFRDFVPVAAVDAHLAR